MIELLKNWPKGEPVPAISIRQPWASLVAWGFKDVENRSSWRYKHRGPMVIHASSSLPYLNDLQEARRLAEEDELGPNVLKSLHPDTYAGGIFEPGAIVGIGNLANVYGPEDETPDDAIALASPWAAEDANYWLYFDEAIPVEPLSYKGRVGLFKVPWDVASKLEEVPD